MCWSALRREGGVSLVPSSEKRREQMRRGGLQVSSLLFYSFQLVRINATSAMCLAGRRSPPRLPSPPLVMSSTARSPLTYSTSI